MSENFRWLKKFTNCVSQFHLVNKHCLGTAAFTAILFIDQTIEMRDNRLVWRMRNRFSALLNFADSLLQSVAISQRNDAIAYAYDFYTRASFRWKNTHPIGSGPRSRRVVEPKTKLQQTPLWFNKLGKKIVFIRELSFIISDYVYSRSWLVSSLATVWFCKYILKTSL